MVKPLPGLDVAIVNPPAGQVTQTWWEYFQSLRAATGSTTASVKGSIFGLRLSATGGNATLTIQPGQASDGTGSGLMVLPSVFTKTVSTSWGLGSAAGALDEGTLSTNTEYYAFLIERPDTAVVDIAISLSEVAPTTGVNIPSAYTLSRYIGPIRIDGGGAVIGFAQTGDYFNYLVGIQDGAAMTVGASRSLVQLSAPPNRRALTRIDFLNGTAGVGLLIQPTLETDRAPGSFPSLYSEVVSKGAAGHFDTLMDGANQIAVRSSIAASTVNIETYGFIDTRGKNSSPLEALMPTTAAPVVLIRVATNDWIIRTPLVNGSATDFTEWFVKNIHLGGNELVLGGISTYENGVRRNQSNYPIHGSVFEYAMDAGLTTDPLGPLWGFYGNGHGNVASTALSIKMDGGADLSGMALGASVAGSSLVILQNYNIFLPKDGVTAFGTLVDTHTFDVAGCLSQHVHTPTLANAGNQNSYSAMLPLTGCNRAKFGSAAAIDITPVNSGQGASQGHQTTIQAWHTDRPDLLCEMILPLGNPGNPDGYSNVTTSDTFAINNTGYTKLYVNYRSGNTGIAAVTSTHATQYRVRRT